MGSVRATVTGLDSQSWSSSNGTLSGLIVAFCRVRWWLYGRLPRFGEWRGVRRSRG